MSEREEILSSRPTGLDEGTVTKIRAWALGVRVPALVEVAGHMAALCDDWLAKDDEIVALLARVEKLEKALRPFAVAFGDALPGIGDEEPVDLFAAPDRRSGVTWGDIRRARKTLARTYEALAAAPTSEGED